MTIKPKGDPEVTLTFGSAKEARLFVARVQRRRSWRQRRVPYTKSVYRIREVAAAVSPLREGE